MVRRLLSSQSHHSGCSTSSSRSDASDHSHSIAPSLYRQESVSKDGPDHAPIHQYRHDHVAHSIYSDDDGYSRSSLDSVDTYASTLASEEDPSFQQPFEVPATSHEVYASDATPSNPAEFAALFPSDRRLLIYHDDATSDGNMNLRVDSYVSDGDGRRRKLTLFHLRMHDLQERKFSLRRYCRDSGREICSSSRTAAPITSLMSAKSNIQQSLGAALQQLRLTHAEPVSDRKSLNQDHYYSLPLDGCHASTAAPSSTNSIQLDFSNYAHVAILRRGSKRSTRYEYEYWGTKYTWKRQVNRDGHFEDVSYYLVSDKTSKSIAHITPEPLTAREAQEEEDLGSWVPPCTMRITDKRVFRSMTDIADTIVATGLMALVDDSIWRRWHSKRSFQLDLPLQQAADYLEPDRLIDEVFNRQAPMSHDNHRWG